jgi:hypothetical protein
MGTMTVQPRPTPEERADTPVELQVDDRLIDLATEIEDWTARQDSWELLLREGTDFGRADNVEAVLLGSAGAQTSSIAFRLDQLSAVGQLGDELDLLFEERDGIGKSARVSPTGLAVELFHISTVT